MSFHIRKLSNISMQHLIILFLTSWTRLHSLTKICLANKQYHSATDIMFTECEWGLFFKPKWMIHSHRLDLRALSTAAWSGGVKPKSTLKCSGYTATAGWWVAIPSNWCTAITSCVQVSLIWQIKIQIPPTRTTDEFVACSNSLGITNAICLRINQAFLKIKIFGHYIGDTVQPTVSPWPSSKVEFYWYHLVRIC